MSSSMSIWKKIRIVLKFIWLLRHGGGGRQLLSGPTSKAGDAQKQGSEEPALARPPPKKSPAAPTTTDGVGTRSEDIPEEGGDGKAPSSPPGAGTSRRPSMKKPRKGRRQSAWGKVRIVIRFVVSRLHRSSVVKPPPPGTMQRDLQKGSGTTPGGDTQKGQPSAAKEKVMESMHALLQTDEAKKMEKVLEEILRKEGVRQKGEDFDQLPKDLRACLLCFSAFPDEWAIRKGEYEAFVQAQEGRPSNKGERQPGDKAGEKGEGQPREKGEGPPSTKKGREDWAIKKKIIIYWWIGENMAAAEGTRTAEAVGEDKFGELSRLGLIEPVYNKRIGVTRECKVHPLVRWMLIEKARELPFLDLDDDTGKPSDDPKKSPRACLTTNKNPPYLSPKSPNSADSPRKPLTALLNTSSRCLNFDKDSMSNVKDLRVLQIGRWHGSAKYHLEVGDSGFLDNIQSLKELRYLGLHGVSRLTELPASISKLGKLEVLDLRGCQNLERMKGKVKQLKKLTHLDLTECFMLQEVPREVGFLSALQVLKGFVFGASRSRNACKLANLERLKKLKKLSINITSQSRIGDHELQGLSKITSLVSLTVTWGKPPAVIKHVKEEDLLAKWTDLMLPEKLEKLDLRCFPQENMPRWFWEAKCLSKLYIRGGKLRRPMQPGDERSNGVPPIKILRLKYLQHLETSHQKLKKIFPELRYLEFFNCGRQKQGGAPKQKEEAPEPGQQGEASEQKEEVAKLGPPSPSKKPDEEQKEEEMKLNALDPDGVWVIDELTTDTLPAQHGASLPVPADATAASAPEKAPAQDDGTTPPTTGSVLPPPPPPPKAPPQPGKLPTQPDIGLPTPLNASPTSASEKTPVQDDSSVPPATGPVLPPPPPCTDTNPALAPQKAPMRDDSTAPPAVHLPHVQLGISPAPTEETPVQQDASPLISPDTIPTTTPEELPAQANTTPPPPLPVAEAPIHPDASPPISPEATGATTAKDAPAQADTTTPVPGAPHVQTGASPSPPQAPPVHFDAGPLSFPDAGSATTQGKVLDTAKFPSSEPLPTHPLSAE